MSYLEDAEYVASSPPGTENLGKYRLRSVHWSLGQPGGMYLQLSSADKPDRWRQLVFAGTLDLPPYEGFDSQAKSLFQLEGCGGHHRLRSATFEGKYVMCSEFHVKEGWNHEVSGCPLHSPFETLTTAQKALLVVEPADVNHHGPNVVRLRFASFPGEPKYLMASDGNVQHDGKKRFAFAATLDHPAVYVSGYAKSLWQLEPVCPINSARASVPEAIPLVASGDDKSLKDKLTELTHAKDMGLLSEEEFAAAKAKLINVFVGSC